MTIKHILISILALAFCNACSSSQEEKSAHKQITGSIEISQSWVRPASKGTNSAGYFSIYNGTAKADTLIGIESQDAENAEVHESYTTGEGLSGMRPAGKLAIASGDSLILEPGGYHVMLIEMNRTLAVGDSLQLQLQFAVAGSKNIYVPIER